MIAPSKKILLNNIAGFLSSHLSKKLLNEGRNVVGIEKFLTFHKTKKCVAISGIFSKEMNYQGIKKAGFIANQLTFKPISLRDVYQRLKISQIDSWFMQYSEGDMSYLGF